MGVLFTLILAGFCLTKTGILPKNTEIVLARLGNNLFMPAAVLRVFIENCTPDRLKTVWSIFAAGTGIGLIMVFIAVFTGKRCTKDPYLRNSYTYVLSFSNFGFMGNAVVSADFPDIFLEYLTFTMPLWIMVNFWGIPYLLTPADAGGHRRSVPGRLRALANPIFLAMTAGAAISLLQIKLPSFLLSAITVSEGCIFPISMLLVGTIAAGMDYRKVVSVKNIYIVSFLRLIVFPMIFIGFFSFIPASRAVVVCTVCSLAMPLGTTTVIVPGSYGKDTSVAAGMAIFSHLASGITIPFVFYALDKVLGMGG